jgi:hypothetical protein
MRLFSKCRRSFCTSGIWGDHSVESAGGWVSCWVHPHFW